MPPGPEYKYISSGLNEPDQDCNKRYRVRSGRHGHSVEILDDYMKRGTHVDVDLDTPISEIAVKFIHLSSTEFNTGKFSGETVWPVIRNHLMSLLLNPMSGLTIGGQTTAPWEVRRTLDPESFAVVDHRHIPDRRGDVHPIYLFRFWWLTGGFNFLQHVQRCSTSYDRIRATLYRAVPNSVDRQHHNPWVQPWTTNRFAISMITPEKWRIQDSFQGKDYYLRDFLIWDMSFDISFWYQMKSSIKDYSCEEYYAKLGSYYSPETTESPDFSDLWKSRSSSPLLANVVGGDRDYGLDEPGSSNVTQNDSECDSLDNEEIVLPPRRSPRPYAVGPEGMHSPIALGDRNRLNGSMPDLIIWDSASDFEDDDEDEGYESSCGSWQDANGPFADAYHGDGDTVIHHVGHPALPRTCRLLISGHKK